MATVPFYRVRPLAVGINKAIYVHPVQAHVQEQILAGGGTILDDLTLDMMKLLPTESVVLIADTAIRFGTGVCFFELSDFLLPVGGSLLIKVGRCQPGPSR